MSDKGTLRERMSAFDAEFEQQQAEQTEQLSEVTGEIARIQEALASLQSQLEALTIAKQSLEEVGAESADRQAAGHKLLIGGLRDAMNLLQIRTKEMTNLQDDQDQRVAEALLDDLGAKLVSDFEKFETETLPVLEALPESYRPILLAKHEETKAALKKHLDAARGDKVEASGDEIVVEVAFAIDAPTKFAELVTLLIPVDPSVQFEWTEREDDLQTAVAARAVQAIYQGFHQLGVPEAQCFFGEHIRMLVVEAEIPEGRNKLPEEVEKTLNEAFSDVFSKCAGLKTAKVQMGAYKAQLEYMLPPADESLESDTAA